MEYFISETNILIINIFLYVSNRSFPISLKFKIILQVSEFIRRFDTRNVRVVTRLQFHRGLDQLKCDLTCTEVKTVMDHYALPDRYLL